MTASNGLIVIAVVLAVATAIALYLSHQALKNFRDHVTVEIGDIRDARMASRAARFRLLGSVCVSLLVLVALIWLAFAIPALLGVPAIVAPGLSVALGFVTSTALPRHLGKERSTRSASLQPRRFWTFGSPRLLAMLLVVAASVVATAIADASATASITGTFPFDRAYWAIAIAVSATALTVAGATVFALGRVASAPLLPTPGLARVDKRLRLLTTRAITALAFSTLLAYLGGIVSGAASRTSNWAQVSVSDGRADRVAAVFGPVLQVLAIAISAAAIASFIIAVIFAITSGREARAQSSANDKGADSQFTVTA